MQSFVFALLLACATAQIPYSGYIPYGVYPGYHASQYHSQDVFGQASYGYAYPGQAASAFRDAAGNQVGSYSYVNPEGKVVRVSYTAGRDGFKVVSNDLPVGPTSDLKAPVDTGVAPLPVSDTAEVIEAKKAHFKAMDEAKSRTTRQIPLAYAHPFAANVHHPIVYSAPAAVEHTIKTAVLEPNAAEKTPAATTLLQEKEITQKVVTPLTYGVAPLATPYAFGAYPYHYAAPYVVATEAKKDRKKRQVPVVPANQFTADLLWDSVDLNQDGQPDKAVVPAPTVVSTPLAYSYSPLAYPFATRALHYNAYPFGYLPLAIKSEEKKETESRKKRQIPNTFSVHNPAEFANDYARSSVDLNQDGTPDNHQFYPYAYSYPYYAGYSAIPYYG